MPEEPRESLEAVRMEKLRRIADLGLDPWGGRFDGHQAIARVRELPVPRARQGEWRSWRSTPRPDHAWDCRRLHLRAQSGR